MNFYQVIILIIVIAISIIAVRISLTFDLNKYLETRRKIKIDQLKNICPHGRIRDMTDDGIITFESFFSSPVGTLKWICSQCNCVVDSEEDVNRINERYKEKPLLVLKKQKRFIKKAKRLKIA